MTTLSESRQADRARMADALRVLALSLGADVEVEPAPYGDPSETAVRIAAGPVRVSVHLRGVAGRMFRGDADTWVLSWHMDTASDARFVPHFTRSVNPFHERKATDVAYGFDHLRDTLARRLAMIRDGLALQPDPLAQWRAPSFTPAPAHP